MLTEYTQAVPQADVALQRMLHGRRESIHVWLLEISFTFFEKLPKMLQSIHRWLPKRI